MNLALVLFSSITSTFYMQFILVLVHLCSVHQVVFETVIPESHRKSKNRTSYNTSAGQMGNR